MPSGLDPLSIMLLAVAVIVLWRLKSVLGTRTGFEKPPLDLKPVPKERRGPDDNVIPLPNLGPPKDDPKQPDPVWKGYAEEGSELAKGLMDIQEAAKGFSVAAFLSGATTAYEMILEAFAAGNKQALKPLLSSEVMESFSSAIDSRVADGHKVKFQFVGIDRTKIIAARLQGKRAQVTVDFRAEMINALTKSSGEVLDGEDQSVRLVEDVWTFERDVTSRDPNWKLVSTDASPGN